MKLNIITSAIIIFILSFSGCHLEKEKKENNSVDIENQYLGQKPPGSTPVLFAPSIISTEAFEFAISFSNDGKDIFFTRRPNNEGGGNSIFHTFLENLQ